MQTQLIKVVPNSVSWTDQAWSTIKENPGKTAGLSVVALSLLPLEVGVAATGIVLGGITAVTVGVLGSLFGASESITEVELINASMLKDAHGDNITQSGIYAHHPDSSRIGFVIPADAFHSTIISEQIADLASFIRSKVHAKTIQISVFSENGMAVSIAADVSSQGIDVKSHAGSARHHSLDLAYDSPGIVPLRRTPFWLKSFPEIETAFEGAHKGRVKRSVLVDTRFGLSASLAKIAGIDANWLGRQRFEVEATFG